MSRWLTKGDENLITVMPECFYRASSVFCDTGENKKTLDSRLETAGMTFLIKKDFQVKIPIQLNYFPCLVLCVQQLPALPFQPPETVRLLPQKIYPRCHKR